MHNNINYELVALNLIIMIIINNMVRLFVLKMNIKLSITLTFY